MGYPRAYRSGSRKYGNGSFQNPLSAPGSGTKPPKPANDNRRPGEYVPPPDPANDNRRGGNNPVKLPEVPEFPGYAADAAPQLFRKLVPPKVRVAWDLVDYAGHAWEIFNDRAARPNIIVPGWNHKCGPVPTIGYNGKYAFYNGAEGDCGLGGQALGGGYDKIGNWLRLSLIKQSTANGRWLIVEGWSRVGVSGAPIGRAEWPQIWVAPRAVPEPMPWTVANPLPASFPAPRGNEMPASRPMPAAVPRSAPAYLPVYVRPNGETIPGSSTQVGSVIVPTVVIPPAPWISPVRRPPGKGEKERKIKATGAFAFMNGALSAASGVYEDAKFAEDIINAFHDALPQKLRSKDRSMQAKLAAVYRNYDKVNIEKAVLGVLIAVAGEKAGAYIDRARNTAARNLDLSLNVSIPTGSAPRI